MQEAANSKNTMVQCHAIALQHAVRASDRQAVSKLVSGLTRGNVKGPLSSMSQCLLIRYVSQVRFSKQILLARYAYPSFSAIPSFHVDLIFILYS